MVVRGFVAAAWIWALNISIQPVQAGMRALIVDSCPPKQQAQASAYASCVTGVGSIFGYVSGFVPLPQVLPWLGDTQFKGLCVIASVALGSTIAITCSAVDERRVSSKPDELRKQDGFLTVFRRIFTRLKTMPRTIKKVCLVQFFAWMGWFPFLFYITTYIGELCKLSTPPPPLPLNTDANTFQIKTSKPTTTLPSDPPPPSSNPQSATAPSR